MSPKNNGKDANTLQGVRKRSYRIGEIDVVIDLLQGFLSWLAVVEVERADAGLDLVRRGDRRWDPFVYLRLNIAKAKVSSSVYPSSLRCFLYIRTWNGLQF